MIHLAEGPRVAIRYISLRDFEELAALHEESAQLLARWMPGGPIVTYADFERYMSRFDGPLNEGFLICLRDTGAIVGRVNVNNIIRGTHQSAMIGYSAYASTTGRGYMTEGLGLLVEHAFGEMGLHRLEANIQPDNTPSLSLIKRVGFLREGYSPNFQFIDGAWRDHERWAITAEMTGA
ncbi:ribosomal-protein-alanine N-acetyltransferase [Nonomuraea thailandensis]|uniref:Ribosomal-protein-alanine N-acetyltransferase n=1 Tax=Nonomuraea thailandensis TaxID=1188745 RepID=A0A9X2GX28_9ACTN|nr:GNAT family protein [Nonomuraea thailandensis]MCP2361963.1 ribosomal-protein-alanine N-acetyltransferase [Nonomuraea thailandensis]